VKPNNIKKNGFDVVVNTWSDTKIWSCFITWVAFDKSFESPGPGIKLFTGRMAFKKTENDFNLMKGDGSRSNKRRIQYPQKYSANPSVVVTLAEMDVTRETDHRLNAVAENVDTQGFDLKVGTWSDTKVWSIGATWFSFGTGIDKKVNKEEEKEEPPAKKNKVQDDKQENKEPADETEKECKICFDKQINTVLVPCGHMCVCEGCSKLLAKNNKCPICKGAIQKIVKTFLA